MADHPAKSPRITAVLCAAVTLAAFLTFLPTVANDFVSYDDLPNLLKNRQVSRGLTFEGVRWAFTNVEFQNWIPLTWISHMADFHLFGPRPGLHHLVSVLLHAACSGLLFLLLNAMTGAPLRSAIAAALFALHPLRVESVAWASERKDVLSMLFGLAAIAAHLRWARGRAAGAYAALFALTACAIMAKPMFVTLPAVLLLLDLWPLNRWRRGGPMPRPSPALLLEKVPLLALSAAASVAAFAAQRAGGAVAYAVEYPFGQRFGNAFRSYGAYLAKTVWPTKLAVFYPYFWSDIPWWQPAAGGAVVAVGCAAAVLLYRRHPAFFAGWVWYLGTLVPVIGFVQVGSQAFADRYSYLPHVGVFVALVWTLDAALANRPGLRRAAVGFAAAACIVFAIVTVVQIGVWRSNETLYRHAIRVTENNFIAYSNLGATLAEQGRSAEANRLIAESFRINPYYRAEVFSRGGDYYAKRGMAREAADQYRKALAIIPYDRLIREKLDKLGPNPPPAGGGPPARGALPPGHP